MRSHFILPLSFIKISMNVHALMTAIAAPTLRDLIGVSVERVIITLQLQTLVMVRKMLIAQSSSFTVNLFAFCGSIFFSLDVNECGFNNGGCKGMCVNLGGTYACKCLAGFYLQEDGVSCGRTKPGGHK